MKTDHITSPQTLRHSLASMRAPFSSRKMKSTLTAKTFALGLLFCSSTVLAMTAANTLIKNQASATFKDESGQQYSVTSNMVETLVQQAAGVDLVQDQGKRVSIGGTAYFPHVVTNTGNGDDQFNLSAVEGTGDDFDFGAGNITFYADLNQDGQADDLSSPIEATPLLTADESFAFVAVVVTPDSTLDGNQATLTLTAKSDFDNNITDSHVDTVDVTNQAIIDVRKSMSATAGMPNTPNTDNYTVTLSYVNTSAVDAINVVLIDALPVGMEYVAGSGIWSEIDTTPLTDADPADAQAAGSSSISYCAYDATCTGIPEAAQDDDSDTTNQVTATIDLVPAGRRGELTFDVKIADDIPASELINIAEHEYDDGSGTVVDRVPTNQVIFTVGQLSGVVTNGSDAVSTDLVGEPITVASISQGGTAIFTDYVWNTGNGEDSFDLSLGSSTFPTGTAIMLYKADGFTPLLDTNGNGTPDTGNLDPEEARAIVIKAVLPPSTSAADITAAGYEVTLTATSFTNDSLSNPAINTLEAITDASVDMTNAAALGETGVLGENIGPENAAVTTLTAEPGSTARFSLYINNTSGAHDNYNLEASTDSTFAALTLPDGWTVAFVDENDYVLTNTGSIAPGTSKLVYADVTLPEGAEVSTTSIYFRGISPNSGAFDIKHDAVEVGEVTDIVITPNNQGQVLPGSVVVYSHWLSNQGNADKTDIKLSQINNAESWSSTLYEDTDGDGVLSSGDTQIDAATLTALAAGDSLLLFNKVYAPASVPMGTNNLTTITASWDGDAESATVEDLTTTNRSDVSIVKKQAPDVDCNGVADVAFSLENFAVEPGDCVIYELVATNTGAEQMLNVRIQDATPAFTQFITAGGLPTVSQGALAAPITNDSEGDVIGNMGTLDSGASASLTFGIVIE